MEKKFVLYEYFDGTVYDVDRPRFPTLAYHVERPDIAGGFGIWETILRKGK